MPTLSPITPAPVTPAPVAAPVTAAPVEPACAPTAEFACSTDGFATLCELFGRVGLGNTLTAIQGGLSTVFAPNDDAFAELPAELLEILDIDDGENMLL